MIASHDSLRRLFAGFVALVALAGIAVQLVSALERSGSIGSNLWIMARYFTILANLLVGIVFARVALTLHAERPALLAGTVLSIMLVGVVYMLLLRGLLELSGGAGLANFLLHIVTPVAAPLYWLAFARKGVLRYRDPLIWLLFPFAYMLYALARGTIDGNYAYPFIDVPRIGWTQAWINGVAIGVGFLAAGCALVWLDHAIGRRSGSSA